MISILCNCWESFFHSKTGVQGCRTAGYMRMGFAVVFLIERLAMLYHLDYFFSPDHGLLPYRVSGTNDQILHQWSIFQYAPESNAMIRIVAALGIIQGTILLLGTARYPRLHLLGIYLNILSFHNHNSLLWDGEDDMFKIWCFLFLFFPLDSCTIYDGFGSSSLSSSSWPMWPFRIFQIEIVLIYISASLGKLCEPRWLDGSSIYWISHGDTDYPGIFNPYFLFGRYGPLKLMCWGALFLEGVCWMTVWIPALRKLSVALMIFLHIGIDLSMQMHMFEFLSCLGWCVFLIQPESKTTNLDANAITDADVGADHNDRINAEGTRSDLTKTKETEASPEPNSNTRMASRVTSFKKAVVNIFVVSFILMISLDILPFKSIKVFLPKSFRPSWGRLKKRRDNIVNHVGKITAPLGLSQDGYWAMYTNTLGFRTSFHIDALLQNSTRVNNIWRSPDWLAMPHWKRKLTTRYANYYNGIQLNHAELLHLVKVVTDPFLEEGNAVESLSFIQESKYPSTLGMESTGGFWDPVVKHPMYDPTVTEIIRVRVRDFKVLYWLPPDDDDNGYDDGYDDDYDDGYDDGYNDDYDDDYGGEIADKDVDDYDDDDDIHLPTSDEL